MLARAVTSLSSLSGGRVVLGIGAGGYWSEIVKMGIPELAPGGQVTAQDQPRVRDREGRWTGGSVTQWTEELASAVIEHGASGFVLFPAGGMQPDLILARWARKSCRASVRRLRKKRYPLPCGVGTGEEVMRDPSTRARRGTPGDREGYWGSAGGLPVADRPVAPAPGPGRETALGRKYREAFLRAHDWLRDELGEIRAVADDVIAG
jgi:hypothetical protein